MTDMLDAIVLYFITTASPASALLNTTMAVQASRVSVATVTVAVLNHNHYSSHEVS